jgi:hypothetical protein
MESWQSGNAADSKSADPVHPGAQVQILYSPYMSFRNVDFIGISTFLKLFFCFIHDSYIKVIFDHVMNRLK